MRAVLVFLTAVLLGLPATADDPPKKLTPAERKEFEERLAASAESASKHYQAGRMVEAAAAYTKALEAARALYPKADFPNGHEDLAYILYMLGSIQHNRGRLAEAESLLREAVDTLKRLRTGDDADVASAMNNLAALLGDRGKAADAETLHREILAMRRRLHKGDHIDIAASLQNLGVVVGMRGKLDESVKLIREALEMSQRMYKGDHPVVAQFMTNLGTQFDALGRLAEAEPLLRDGLAMRRRLFPEDKFPRGHPAIALSLYYTALLHGHAGRITEAEAATRESLEMRRRLYKGDHPDLASSLNSLGSFLSERGDAAGAEAALRESLEMRKRMFKGDHPTMASSLNNLAMVLSRRGRYAEAEPLIREALEMRKRLFKGDHPDVAMSLDNLANVLHRQQKLADSEPIRVEAVAMYGRLYKRDHPDTAIARSNLAHLLHDLGKSAEAEEVYRDVLAMQQRLFGGDHTDVAVAMNNLASVCLDRGKLEEADRLHRESLEMIQRLHKGNHPFIAAGLANLGRVRFLQGRYEEAAPLFRDSIRTIRGLVEDAARVRAEGDALTYLAAQPPSCDGFLTTARHLKLDPEAVYAEVLGWKGFLGRVYAGRALAARVAATDPAAAAVLTELTDARRRRAELILAPTTRDPATRKQRAEDVQTLTDRIATLDEKLRSSLPAAVRTEEPAATPADLRKALPDDAVLVDFLGYKQIEYDKTNPAKGETRTRAYSAFVVTKAGVKWIDLGPAAPIEKAIGFWREAITTPPFRIPADIPARVRELVWAKVRGEFPEGTKVVYISPDLALTRVPWSALPGDTPDRIVLEEFAVALAPHGAFLLDQLGRRDPRTARDPGKALVVGGVGYDTPPASSVWANLAAAGTRTRGELPIKPGDTLRWSDLKWTKAEAEIAARLADRKQLGRELLTGLEASADRVLEKLPQARYAHLATHGFFADASFRSVLQVDPGLFTMTHQGERVGAGAASPMTVSGLAFAGANLPETRGRGLVTGEHLIDRDLSGLELAVLSACETGLGDVAGGEGVFGLQRAFHLAGAWNVVASLWKVDDLATTALMNEFYTQLWEKDQPPVIALQKAQLAVYRADPKRFVALAARGIEEGTLDLSKVPVKTYPPTGKGNHPALWAAFTISGSGR